MGADKRLMPVDGVPLLLRVLAVVQPLAAETLLATARAHPLPRGFLAGLAVRLVEDRIENGGPLAGIEASLLGARHDLVLLVGGDHPWLQAGVLELLVAEAAARADVAAVVLGGPRGPEPLLAVYRRAARPTLTRLLDAGERRAGRLLEELPTAVLPELRWRPLDPQARSLVNLNTPADAGQPDSGPMTR